jgi:hypothetical protein
LGLCIFGVQNSLEGQEHSSGSYIRQVRKLNCKALREINRIARVPYSGRLVEKLEGPVVGGEVLGNDGFGLFR